MASPVFYLALINLWISSCTEAAVISVGEEARTPVSVHLNNLHNQTQILVVNGEKEKLKFKDVTHTVVPEFPESTAVEKYFGHFMRNSRQTVSEGVVTEGSVMGNPGLFRKIARDLKKRCTGPVSKETKRSSFSSIYDKGYRMILANDKKKESFKTRNVKPSQLTETSTEFTAQNFPEEVTANVTASASGSGEDVGNGTTGVTIFNPQETDSNETETIFTTETPETTVFTTEESDLSSAKTTETTISTAEETESSVSSTEDTTDWNDTETDETTVSTSGGTGSTVSTTEEAENTVSTTEETESTVSTAENTKWDSTETTETTVSTTDETETTVSTIEETGNSEETLTTVSTAGATEISSSTLSTVSVETSKTTEELTRKTGVLSSDSTFPIETSTGVDMENSFFFSSEKTINPLIKTSSGVTDVTPERTNSTVSDIRNSTAEDYIKNKDKKSGLTPGAIAWIVIGILFTLATFTGGIFLGNKYQSVYQRRDDTIALVVRDRSHRTYH